MKPFQVVLACMPQFDFPGRVSRNKELATALDRTCRHARGLFQKLCCCSIATVSRGGRSFGSGQLVVASVFCRPCYGESKLSRPGLGQAATFHLHLGKEKFWRATAKLRLPTASWTVQPSMQHQNGTALYSPSSTSHISVLIHDSVSVIISVFAQIFLTCLVFLLISPLSLHALYIILSHSFGKRRRRVVYKTVKLFRLEDITLSISCFILALLQVLFFSFQWSAV